MFKDYIHLKKITDFQKNLVNEFNLNPQIEYEEISKCEICHSSDLKLMFNNDRYGINQKTCYCNKCGFVFSNPRMNKSSTEHFYNSDFYRYLYSNEEFNEEKLYKNALNELHSHMPAKPKKPNFDNYYDQLYFDFINHQISDFESVLDIGCGKGKKLIDFNFIGKKAEGIEPSIVFHKVHSSFGLNTEIGFIKDVRKKYDLVMLTHVLEHLTNLEIVIDSLANITSKYLFIEVPGHIKKLQAVQNAHNYYFSINTLNHFILNNKFKLIKIDYARDNEYILALYEKTNKKSSYHFCKLSEKRIIKRIINKYALGFLFFKFLKIFNLEKLFKKIFFILRSH